MMTLTYVMTVGAVMVLRARSRTSRALSLLRLSVAADHLCGDRDRFVCRPSRPSRASRSRASRSPSSVSRSICIGAGSGSARAPQRATHSPLFTQAKTPYSTWRISPFVVSISRASLPSRTHSYPAGELRARTASSRRSSTGRPVGARQDLAVPPAVRRPARRAPISSDVIAARRLEIVLIRTAVDRTRPLVHPFGSATRNSRVVPRAFAARRFGAGRRGVRLPLGAAVRRLCERDTSEQHERSGKEDIDLDAFFIFSLRCIVRRPILAPVARQKNLTPAPRAHRQKRTCKFVRSAHGAAASVL